MVDRLPGGRVIRWLARALVPSYQGHCVHVVVGLALGVGLSFTHLPPWFTAGTVALLGLHELYDGDLFAWPLNGWADVLAFLPGGWWVLGLRWEVLAVLLAYVAVQALEGRRLSR